MDDTVPQAQDQGVLALEGWEQPARRQPGPGVAPVLAVDGFEGPLDWLLDLARTRRIDLARLSIVALVEAFEAALTTALAVPDVRPALLGRWGDWLVMAADLTLLRSRMLMPADAAEAQAAWEAAERLRQRVLGRAQIGRAADWLEGCGQLGRDVFTRGQGGESDPVRAERTVDITGLLRACLAAIRLPAELGAGFRVPGPPFWSVADAARSILQILPRLGGGGGPLEAFLPPVPAEVPDRALRCRVAVAGTFLAGLELARDSAAELSQTAPWQSIRIGQPGPAPVSTAAGNP